MTNVVWKAKPTSGDPSGLGVLAITTRFVKNWLLIQLFDLLLHFTGIKMIWPLAAEETSQVNSM
jgi:hypothetical protein